MIYKVENDFLNVEVKKMGAELCSIFHKQHQLEYLWQADPKVWARHAPILFPIVGQVQDGTYIYKNDQYQMGQHGFARDSEFELVDQTDNSLTLRLKFDGNSLLIYPFRFELVIQYILEEQRLTSNYQVHNLDQEELYFSLGLHPGFTCPIEAHLKFSDYYLEFDQVETVDCLIIEGSLLSNKALGNFINNSQKIALDHSLFDNDALIFENLVSSSVMLKSDQSKHFVKVGISDFPYLGIWSKPSANAPYLCIEPWYGITDEKDSGKPLDQKKGIQRLKHKKMFECSSYFQVG